MDQQGYGQPPQGYGQQPPPGWGPPPQQQPKKRSLLARFAILFGVAVLVLIVGVAALAFMANAAREAGKAASSSLENAGNDYLNSVHAKVLKDAADQYNLVKSTGGSAMQLCTQAGMAYAAAVQAKDEGAVRAWQRAQKQDCTAAGVPTQ